jgi:nicotinamidase-related amidase
MSSMKRIAASALVAATLAALGACAVPVAHAKTIVDEWSSVTVPPPPKLEPVTIDPKTTALLMLDFVKQTCNEQRRPRCIASLPEVAKLLKGARASGTFVAYSYVIGGSPADILKEVARTDREPTVFAGPDKFLNTDLDKILKDHGIKTVIVVGTAAHGAVLYTASEAALRGYKVIVPVDGSTAESTYAEQYVAWNLVNAPLVSKNVTLTSIAQVKF